MHSTDYLSSPEFLARAARARTVLEAGRLRHEREVCTIVTGIDVDAIEIVVTKETMLGLAERLCAGDHGRSGVEAFLAVGGSFSHRGPHLTAQLRDVEILTDVPGTTLRQYAHAVWRWHQSTILIFGNCPDSGEW